MFNPESYIERVHSIKSYIDRVCPHDFHPSIALTLGSGGTSDFIKQVEVVAKIPYSDIPGFFQTTVPGHVGQLVMGKIEQTQIMIFSGRKHLYELGYTPDLYNNLKEITLPVYLAAKMGVKLYMATNAAGGLNSGYKVGDLMLISSHLDLFFPNPLFGPELPWPDSPRFQPQTGEYNQKYRELVLEIAQSQSVLNHVHEGVYVALTGPTFESVADCQALCKLGVDAVGMSTIPEVIVATNIGLETLGFSLITNVVNSQGQNATSHEEVQSALNKPEIRNRFFSLLSTFISNY